MSRTYLTYERLMNLKCQQCHKRYMKPRCLQNHIILKHSISISVPSSEGINNVLEPRGSGRSVFRQLQNIPHYRPCSIQNIETAPSKRPKPSPSNSTSDPVSPQRKEIESNPLFDVDVLGLVELDPLDTQENWESVIKNSQETDNPDALQEHNQEQRAPINDNPFLNALDGIEFDVRENAKTLNDENITYAHTSDQLQPSMKKPDQPLAVPEDDSLLFSNVNCFEDLLTFE